MLCQKLLVSSTSVVPPAGDTLYTWGSNTFYATVQGIVTGSTQVPTFVTSFTDIADIGYGLSNIVVLKQDGTLWSAGRNSFNQCGLNTATTPITAFTQIGTDTDWAKISIGSYFYGMAIKTNGKLYSWGLNDAYQTAQGTSSGDTPSPTQVGTDTDWASVSAGVQVVFAIKTNGTMYSWGSNLGGATAQGTSAGNTTTPTQVGTDTDWASVSTGSQATLAIKTTGTLWGAGYQGNGNIGLGSGSADITSMTQVGSATNWSLVSCGDGVSAIIKTNGTLYTCGINSNGATGQNTTVGTIFTPTQVGSATDWVRCVVGGATVGNRFCIAVKGAGELWAWGSNNVYQLGDNSTTNSLVPIQISLVSGWVKLAAGSLNSAATGVAGDGLLYSFGSNLAGATGQNTTTGDTTTPTVAVSSNNNWVMLSAAGSGGPTKACSAGLLSDGTLWTWGSNNNGSASVTGSIAQGSVTTQLSVPTKVGVATDWVWITQGSYGGLAIKTNGTMYSWGTDSSGQLGQGGGATFYYTPTQVGSDTDWAKVWTSIDHTFAIKTNGTLWVCGANVSYQTGRGTSAGQTTTFTQVGSATNWTWLTPITEGGVGIRADGTAWSWGTDYYGELGQGGGGSVKTAPTQIGALTTWARSYGSASSMYVTFLIKTDGTLWVCGQNQNYATGLGTNAGNTTTITQVGSATWLSIGTVGDATGVNFGAIGLRSDHTIWSWGSNANYQTGQGTNTGSTTSPTQIGTNSYWAIVSAGGDRFCLLSK